MPSMSTSISPSSALNPVPMIVTSVPPWILPSWGNTVWISARYPLTCEVHASVYLKMCANLDIAHTWPNSSHARDKGPDYDSRSFPSSDWWSLMHSNLQLVVLLLSTWQDAVAISIEYQNGYSLCCSLLRTQLFPYRIVHSTCNPSTSYSHQLPLLSPKVLT